MDPNIIVRKSKIAANETPPAYLVRTCQSNI